MTPKQNRAETKKSNEQQRRRAREDKSGVQCQVCHTTNDLDARYCEDCGAQLGLSEKCPYCSAAIDAEAEVCEKCGRWLATEKCRFCSGHLEAGENFCSECATPVSGIRCPVCRKLSETEFCPDCSTPLTAMAKEAVQRASLAKEKMTKLMHDVQELQARTSSAVKTDEEIGRERQGLQTLESLMREVKAKRTLAPGKTKKKQAIFTKDESELLQKKAEIRKQMEEQSKITFKTTQEARRYFQAVKPSNALGWVCNYKNTVHPSPDGCMHPEHGGHWELFTDITWVSTNEDV